MSKFNTGLDVQPTTEKLGFTYGQDCFGPEVENRTLDSIRKSLSDPNASGPETVYSIAMDVGKKEHLPKLKDLHLLYGVVTYAAGKIGKEPVRSQGHIHKKSVYGNNWSTPEVYEIWSGEAIIYMQETANDDPGRCFAVHAKPGEVVIVPPGWAHATISANTAEPLTFGAWCDREYGFDYDDVRAHKGLAWFPIVGENNKIKWIHNDAYIRSSELIEKSPRIYEEFDIDPGKSIYKQFEENNEIFNFVPLPETEKVNWVDFTP
ncbi:MAG: glucose-6-phosphate isomerase family protein [Bacteroidota bacterium]